MTKLFFLTTIVFGIFLSGCSYTKDLVYEKKDKSAMGFHKKTNVYINYGALTDEAVTAIFCRTAVPQRIIVTDFVDVTSLDNQRRLGYVLSNNMKNSLINNYEIDVVEAEVSKYFKISGNGLKILSRDIDKLRATNFNVQYAIVGTYTYSSNELIIFVKLIDLKTGIIKGSYAKTFPMGEGTKMMLSHK